MIDTSGRIIYAVLDTALETRVFGTDLAERYKAVEYHMGALRLKDKIDAKMSGVAALEQIENASPERPRGYVEATYKDGWSAITRKVQ